MRRIWIDPDKLNCTRAGRGRCDPGHSNASTWEGPGRGAWKVFYREANVRMAGEALNVAEMRKLVIASPTDIPFYLSDVALVEDGL